jgi:hypothetical protein
MRQAQPVSGRSLYPTFGCLKREAWEANGMPPKVE